MTPEIFQHRFTDEELKNICRTQKRPMRRRLILSLFSFTTLSILSGFYIQRSDQAAFLAGIGICLSFLFGAALVNTKKRWQAISPEMLRQVNQYKIYEDHFTLEVFQEEELIRFFKVTFFEITMIQDYGEYYSIDTNRANFLIFKKDLENNSSLTQYIERQPQKLIHAKRLGKVSALNALTILGVFIVYIIGLSVDETRQQIGNWIAICLLPLPISSIIYSFKCIPSRRLIMSALAMLLALLLLITSF